MEWKDLAPWIAIAITLALSILVPLFTQMANNSHQRKMQKEKIEYEKSQEKEKVFKELIQKVGSAITCPTTQAMEQAGASIFPVYLYAPEAWWDDLDNLSVLIKKGERNNALSILQQLSKLIAQDLSNKEASK